MTVQLINITPPVSVKNVLTDVLNVKPCLLTVNHVIKEDKTLQIVLVQLVSMINQVLQNV